jgi:hypothetical protein
MSRRESIIYGYTITITLAVIICIILLFGKTNQSVDREPDNPDREAVIIDGQNIETVTDENGSYYLKYFIGGPQKYIYIPLPEEVDVRQSDTLEFYYIRERNKKQKSENNGKQSINS